MAPAKAFDADIHKAKGFGCVACHGGDATAAGMEAMDPAKGFIGKPKRQQIPQVCGRCHADAGFMKRYNPSLRVDQVAEYATSVHGRRLRELGDPKVATCTSCHPAHEIRPPSDPKSSVYPLRVADTCGGCHGDAKYMSEYKIPTDQLAKYKTSVHWKAMTVKGDLSAPTCNDCHGNHGAVPPGINWVGNVCGQCHSVMADLFKKSVHAKAFAEMGNPGCATCHEPHGGENQHLLRAASPNKLCLECHGPEANPKKLESEHLVTIFNGAVKLPEDYFRKVTVLPLKYGRGHPTEGHPVTDVMDPSDTSKVLKSVNCLSCHQPHSSAQASLLIKDQSNNMVFCMTCHTGFAK